MRTFPPQTLESVKTIFTEAAGPGRRGYELNKASLARLELFATPDASACKAADEYLLYTSNGQGLCAADNAATVRHTHTHTRTHTRTHTPRDIHTYRQSRTSIFTCAFNRGARGICGLHQSQVLLGTIKMLDDIQIIVTAAAGPIEMTSELKRLSLVMPANQEGKT